MKKTKKPATHTKRAALGTPKRGDAVRERLISACGRLLKTHSPSEITTAMLLTEANVARGTLYHHFTSASALVELTMLEAFSKHVDANIVALRTLMDQSANQTIFADGLRQITKVSQSAARKETRFARARLIVYSERSTELRIMLAREQERLTKSIEDIVVTGQKKGWVKRSIKPRVVAVLIQAYTLGKIVDDVVETRTPEADWNSMIDEVVIGGLLTATRGN